MESRTTERLIDTNLKGSPGQGLFAATLGFFVGFAAVSLFGPTARLLRDTMGLTPGEVGLLVAIPSLTGSLLRIPFGAWVDTSGGRKPFAILLLLSLAGMAGLLVMLAGLYPDGLTRAQLPLLLFLGALCGCGIATFSVGIGQVSYWYPQARQGTALGTYAGLGNLAPGIFSLLIPLLIGVIGLTGTYGVWLAMLVAGTAAYLVLGRNAWYFQLWRGGSGLPREEAIARAERQGQELFPTGGVLGGLKATACIGYTWCLVSLYFLSFGGFLALTAWLPTYWGDHFELSATLAGALTMLYSVLASAIRVPGGMLADRFGGERTARASFILTLAGAILLAANPGLAGAIAGVVIMGAGMGVANAAVFKLVPKYLAAAGGGAGAGWVGGLGAFGGFVIPPLLGGAVGLYGPETGYANGFILFVILAAGAVAVTTLLAARTARPAPVQVSKSVFCHYHGVTAEIVVQADSGDMPASRVISCSLVPGHMKSPACNQSCLAAVKVS